MSLGGPNAVFVDAQVERWLVERTGATGVRHLVHAPSNPFGWSAGKWGEWYPDLLDLERGQLTTTVEKPYWQEGWLRQHDRLVQAMSEQAERVPLIISGDLHAIGVGRIHREGGINLDSRPITAVLSGPIEDHGFTLVEFRPDRMVLRQFKWDVDLQPLDAIDRLEPFYTTELPRPA